MVSRAQVRQLGQDLQLRQRRHQRCGIKPESVPIIRNRRPCRLETPAAGPQPSTPGAAERRSLDHRPDAGASAAAAGSSSGGSEYHAAAPSEPSSSFESINRVAVVAGQQYASARRSSRRQRQLEKEDLRRAGIIGGAGRYSLDSRVLLEQQLPRQTDCVSALDGSGDGSAPTRTLVPPPARVVRDSSGSVSAWLVASASATAGVPSPIGPDAAAAGNATCAAAHQAGGPSVLLPSIIPKTAAEPAAAQPGSKSSRGSSGSSGSGSEASSRRRRFFKEATSRRDGKPEPERLNPITALGRLLRF